MLKKLSIFIFILAGFAWSFSVSAATCPMDNGAGVGCNAGNNEYYCGGACRQLSAGTTPTLNHCQNNFQVCAPGVDCTNSYAAAFPCGVPQACNGGFTLCSISGTSNSSFPDSKCKANVGIPAGCSSYNQCTSVCSACSAGYELLAGNCIGATVRLGTDSVMSDRLKNSTMPLMSILSSGNVGIGATDPNDIFSIGNSGSAPAGSPNTGHNFTSTYLGSDDYALTNYGLVKTLINSAASTSALWAGVIGGNVWNLNSGNVGIGTTNPGAKMDVYRNTTGIGLNIRHEAISGVNTGISSSLYGTGTGTYVAGYFNALGTGINNVNLMLGNSLPPSSGSYDIYASSGWSNYFSGKVGVGITNPSYKLEVVGGNMKYSSGGAGFALFDIEANSTKFRIGKEGTTGANIMIGSLAGAGVLNVQDANALQLGTNNTAQLTILSTGNVGIGTTNPQSKLTISGALSNSTSQLNILNTEGGNFIWRSGISGISNNGASFLTANVDGSGEVARMVIQASTGNVGIGTISPNDKFSIGNSGSAAPAGSANTGHNFSSSYLDTDDYALTNYALVKTLITNNGLWSGAKNGNIWNGDAGAGNIGIGTTAPGAKLTIADTNKVIDSNGNLFIYTTDTATQNYGGQISLGGSWNGTSGTKFGTISGRKEVVGSGNAAGYLSFGTASSVGGTVNENMRITSTGFVGIGITNPTYGLQVQGGPTRGTALFDTGTSTSETQVVIRARTGTNGGYTNAPFQIRNLSDSIVAYIRQDGVVAGQTIQTADNNSVAFMQPAGAPAAGLSGLRLNSTTAISWSSGPSWWNTTDTGITRLAAGKIAIGNATAGDYTGTLITGNIGIGITAPNDKLSIGSAGVAAPAGSADTGHNYTSSYIGTDDYALANYGLVKSLISTAASSNALWGGTTGGNVWSLNSGNVGIGTTAPGEKLDVSAGNMRLDINGWLGSHYTGQTTFRPILGFDGSGVVLRSIAASTGINFQNSSGATQMFMQESTGNVGIGTTTPAFKLDVVGNIKTKGAFISYDGNNYGGGKLYSSYGYTNGEVFIQPAGSSNPTVFSPNGGVVIGPQTSNPPANGLLVSGSVGIGTTNPTSPLEIFAPGNTAWNSVAKFLAPSNITAGNAAQLVFGVSNTTKNASDWRFIYAGNSSNLNRIELGIAGVVAPMITYLPTGNVGIGTIAPNDIFSIGNSGAAPAGSPSTGHNFTSTYLGSDDYALVNYGIVKTLISSATSSIPVYNQPTYSTSTPATYIGNQGGSYSGANAFCAATISGSHVCTTAEIFNTINSGHTNDIPLNSTLWINNGPPGYTANANDCMGWTTSGATSYGAVWVKTASGDGFGSLQTCTNSRKYACCK